MGENIHYNSPSGQQVPGYLAAPAGGGGVNEGGGAPGVVVIQEWWGLNDQIKGVADRLAGEGYRALVPDLYRGRVTQSPDEANHMMTGLDWAGATGEDVRGAVQHLKANGGKAAVLGFCMGGAITIIAGVKIPELDAAICFYGIPPAEAADPAAIRVPFLGHFATQDDWCTPEAVNGLEDKLNSAGIQHTLHRYDAQHGFFNEQRPEVHDAVASKDAWERSLAFLQDNL
ncbi:MAG: dienelactone hydrolase family protein [bacterium]